MENVVKVAKKMIDEPDYVMAVYDLEYVWLSVKFLSLSGYSREEMKGIRFIDLIHAPGVSESQLRQEFVKRISQGEGVQEYVGTAKDGSLLHAKYKYKYFEVDGDPFMTGKLLEVEEVNE